MLDLILSGNLVDLIKTVGYVGLFFIVFAESGLLFGFFLPGDSLLFTAGFLASQGYLDFYLAFFLVFLAAIMGDSVGYAFGKIVGPKIFKKEDSFFFRKENITKAQVFYEKYGAKTIVMARFLPIVRTFAPIVAGIGRMDYKKFLFYNIAGGFIWSFGLMASSYYLGKVIPNMDKYLLPIILLIIFLSILPTLIHIIREKRKNLPS